MPTIQVPVSCPWGQVKGAYVPSVTFCHLTLQNNLDNSRFDIGSYVSGFWNQDQKITLPFLPQSFQGNYTSPQLNSQNTPPQPSEI